MVFSFLTIGVVCYIASAYQSHEKEFSEEKEKLSELSRNLFIYGCIAIFLSGIFYTFL